jgi:hypothetical protein
MNKDNTYRNWSIQDYWYSDKKHEEEMAKYAALDKLASQPATSNTLLYIMPVAALVIFGVVFAVVMKKKKSK